MKSVYLIPVFSLLGPAIANAQPEQSLSQAASADQVEPADHALEIGVGAGFSSGGGPIGGGQRHLEDVANPGGAFELDLGYRVTPNLVLGGYGTLAAYQTGDAVDTSSDVFAATAGLQAGWHFRPTYNLDPWVKVGTGWKSLWVSQDHVKTTALQGLELARVQVGLDYRASKTVAIAPVIGGSVDMFLAQDTPMTTSYDEISSKKVNFTGFAGVVGTFDLAGR